MEIKQAGLLNFSAFHQQNDFNHLCQFAESLDIGISDEYIYRTRDGTILSLGTLVRQADWANIRQKGRVVPTSLLFILSYLNAGYVPFLVFNNAAIVLAQKYQSKFGISIDEKTAMAAVLMVSIGYEQTKLNLLRKMAENHNSKARQRDNNAPVCGVATANLYTKYHIDFLEMVNNKIVQAYQVERTQRYFEVLQYQKEGSGLTLRQLQLMNENRAKLNRFLDEYPERQVSFLTYQKKEGSGVHILVNGLYAKVAPAIAQ